MRWSGHESNCRKTNIKWRNSISDSRNPFNTRPRTSHQPIFHHKNIWNVPNNSGNINWQTSSAMTPLWLKRQGNSESHQPQAYLMISGLYTQISYPRPTGSPLKHLVFTPAVELNISETFDSVNHWKLLELFQLNVAYKAVKGNRERSAAKRSPVTPTL